MPPSGAKARFRANMAAIALVRELGDSRRPVTSADQETLAAWSGWGAIPEVFEEREGWAAEAAELREALTTQEYAAARANTLNAHYTDPAVAGAMWRAVASTGMGDGARVLEPGCGTGTFMAHAPEGVSMLGIEVDPVTARIAHYLHPDVQVRLEGFEQTIVRQGMVDGAIGNVPFGSFSLHDPAHNPSHLPIHNHFIVKSLAATRPGGLVAVVTSAWTMEGGTSTSRSEIAKLGDLVAGVRLPGRAFTRVAGTDVTTDILVFQRRETVRPVPDLDALEWGRTEMFDEESGVTINRYFARHPERVLGEMSVRMGRFGHQLEVDGPTGLELGAAVEASLTAQLAAASVRWVERPAPLAIGPGEDRPGLFERLPEAMQPMVGSLMVRHAGSGLSTDLGPFVRWTGTQWESAKVAKNAARETQALLEIRDAMQTALGRQSDGGSSEADRAAARSALSAAYDRYVETWGPINRFTVTIPQPGQARIDKAVEALESAWRKGLPEWMDAADRAEADPGEELRQEWIDEAREDLMTPRKNQRHLVPLAGDPSLGAMLGLEVFDEETQSARKALIFSQDIVSAAVTERHAETMDDAVAISMDESQSVEVERVAQLLGVSVDEAEVRLAGAAFKDPETGAYVPAALYLSGQVRDKLTAATEALDLDSAMQANIAALEGVMPEWIGIEQIDLVPGVNVLDAADYADFARQTFGVDCSMAKDTTGGSWKVKSPAARAFSEDVQFRFGTQTRKPTELLESLMNQKPVVVRYKDTETNKMVVDRAESAAARQKCDAISARFSAWVLEKPELRERVEQEWNQRFNQYVEPDFSKLGERLALPGLSGAFVPHAHQREAVARVLHSPATLLNHVVGAGKTGTMVMAAMEMRRTGQARKPWMVVPNHLVEQATREAGQWYPGARILSIPTGISPVERQTWIARSAAQDWDIVVCPQSVFKLVGVDPGRAHGWISQQIRELEQSKGDLDSGSRAQIKALEAQIKTLTTKADRLLDAKDPGMTFEQTGCDYLLVDEAHHYKNLQRASDITDLNCTGSQIASDLDMKIHALREFRIELARRAGTWTPGMVPHVADFATGTPVANNMAEMWVMQRYLRPDLLEAQGTDSLREWARAFARSSQALEMKADGATWIVKDRVRSFANVPELVATNRAFMSTVTKEDLQFALPALVGGERQVHVRPASDEVKAYIQELRRRADNPPANPREDNILKVLNDGRLVAIDPQMRGLEADEDGGRIGMLADTIFATWQRTKDTEYRAPDGEIESLKGGLQIVFCYQGIPGGDGFNLYGCLRENLVDRGMDPGAIAFIHDATDDASRGELFERCRDGRVSVLVGSTARMGTGVNVQKRAVALHHMDVPWRPADLEQREGRVIRQGNQNENVEIHTYVTQGTLDAMMWQTIERKAAFIAQLMQGRVEGRSFEQDDSDLRRLAGALSAVAADNPLVLERAEVMDRLMQLEARASAHRTTVGSMRARLFSARGQLGVEERSAAEKAGLLETVDLNGPMYVSPAGAVYERQGEASDALREQLLSARAAIAAGEMDGTSVGTVRGVEFAVSGRGDRWRIEAVGAPSVGFGFEATLETIATTQFVLRLENRVGAIDEDIARHQGNAAERSQVVAELERVLEQQGEFPEAADLEAATLRLTEIDGVLGMAEADGEIETPMVYSDHLRRLQGPRVIPERARDLRVGDVFRWGQGRDHYIVMETDEGGQVLAAVDGDEAGSTRNVRAYEQVDFIARRRAALTPWERTVIDAAPRDRLCRASEVPPGRRVICEGEDGSLVHGTVRLSGSIRTVAMDDLAWGGTPADARQICFVRDYWTPEQAAAQERMQVFPQWSSVVPGSVVVRAWAQDGSEIPEAAGCIRLPHYDGLRDGNGTPVRAQPVRAEVVAPAPATAEELQAVGVTEPVPVTELRVGDRVPIAQVDRDARSERLVTVVEPSSRYPARSAETGYVTDEGDRHTGRIKPETLVDVQARAIFAMDAVERLALARARGRQVPGAKALNADDVADHVGELAVVIEGASTAAGPIVESRRGGGMPSVYSVRVKSNRDLAITREQGAVVVNTDVVAVEAVAQALSATAGLDQRVLAAHATSASKGSESVGAPRPVLDASGPNRGPQT